MLLVVVFADPMMKDQIVSYIANGYASFDGQFLVHSTPQPSSALTLKGLAMAGLYMKLNCQKSASYSNFRSRVWCNGQCNGVMSNLFSS
jgi:hypothetical protein